MGRLTVIIIGLFFVQCKTEVQNTAQINADISVEQAATFIKEGYTLIDLRTDGEILESGTISGSQHIDFRGSNFKTTVSQLPKNKKYVLYCRSGGRSSRALTTFKEANLEAYNMLGGYTEWAEKSKISK